jgi:hypothetical protein
MTAGGGSKEGGSVSRVLSPVCTDGWRSFILTSRCRLALPIPQEATYPLLSPGPGNSMLDLAGGGVYPADAVTGAAVRSCRTISPLPVPQRFEAIGCVFSVALSRGSPGPHSALFHKMRTGPGWPLATTVPCPARTFLRLYLGPATARPTLFNLLTTIYDK